MGYGKICGDAVVTTNRATHTPAMRPLLRVWFGLNIAFGLALVYWIPPGQSPDEPNHFFRAYSISEGRWWLSPTEDWRLGDSLPESLSAVLGSFQYLKNDYQARMDANIWRKADALPLAPAKRVFTDFANTAIYAPTAYLPQALGIWLARQTGAGPLRLLYAARLGNLIVWLILLGLSLRMLPGKSFAWMMAASFPAVSALAASANADMLTNGLCFWLLAWFWKNRGSWNSPVVIALLIVGIQKLVTLPFAWLLAAQGAEHVWRRLLWPVLITLGALAFTWTAQHTFIPYDRYHADYRDAQTLNEGVDPAGQLHYIRKYPIRFAAICIKSWVQAAPSIAAHLTGKFGWEKNYLPSWSIALLWIGWLGLLVMESGPPVSKRRALVYLVIIIAYCCLFSVTMYALWHPVGSPVLGNLQGRYFFPLLPLVVMFSAALRLYRGKWAGRWAVLAFSGWIIGQLALLEAIWGRYWTI